MQSYLCPERERETLEVGWLAAPGPATGQAALALLEAGAPTLWRAQVRPPALRPGTL